MKKIVLFTAALFALGMVAFAKPAKVSGWKDVAKIANKNKMEVVNDETIWYVAKGNGGKDFAIYAIDDYDDIKVTLEMSCIGGEVYSRIICIDKEADAPFPMFALGWDDQKCVLANADNLGVYYDDAGLAAWTEECKNQRAKLLGKIAKEYGLVVPKK
ncbi:MAG: hypothetical protein J6V90_06320 [Treponema sp.]|nr:hypothetical protein [Treponema sp.]